MDLQRYYLKRKIAKHFDVSATTVSLCFSNVQVLSNFASFRTALQIQTIYKLLSDLVGNAACSSGTLTPTNTNYPALPLPYTPTNTSTSTVTNIEYPNQLTDAFNNDILIVRY